MKIHMSESITDSLAIKTYNLIAMIWQESDMRTINSNKQKNFFMLHASILIILFQQYWLIFNNADNTVIYIIKYIALW